MQPSIRPLQRSGLWLTASVTHERHAALHFISAFPGGFRVTPSLKGSLLWSGWLLAAFYAPFRVVGALCLSSGLIVPRQGISQAAVQLSSAFSLVWVGVLRSEMALSRGIGLWEHADLMRCQVILLNCVSLINSSVGSCDHLTQIHKKTLRVRTLFSSSLNRLQKSIQHHHLKTKTSLSAMEFKLEDPHSWLAVLYFMALQWPPVSPPPQRGSSDG